MGKPLNLGIVGCGVISKAYLDTFERLNNIKVHAVADVIAAQAEKVAAERSVVAMSPDELYHSSEVDLVVNLTNPAAHVEVANAALAAGKHVYGEKPLSLEAKESAALLETAGKAGLQIGSAPDTVLGAGCQTARSVVDSGGIGQPVAATAFMASSGPESWHINPEFYFQPGGGPLYDMGPYYLSALIQLLGPVRTVTAMTARGRQSRVIGRGPKAGKVFEVEVETHVAGVLEHHSGAISTLITSFDMWGSHLPRIEVHGTEGSLSVPDPNGFAGTVELLTAKEHEWRPVEVSAGYADSARGYGVADLARGLETGRAPRASGAVAHHVVDIMESLLNAASQRRVIELSSTCTRPDPVPANVPPEEA